MAEAIKTPTVAQTWASTYRRKSSGAFFGVRPFALSGHDVTTRAGLENIFFIGQLAVLNVSTASRILSTVSRVPRKVKDVFPQKTKEAEV